MVQTDEERRAKAAAAMRRWRAKNPRPATEEQLKKGRERGARWRAAHPGRKYKHDPTAAQRHPWARNLGVRQAHAKKRGIPFTLKVADAKAVWTGKCAITGLLFDMRTGLGAGPRPFSPSLDRIVPSLGYVPGNIRFVLQCVNAFRGTMNDGEMASVAKAIVAACYTYS